MLSVCDNAAQQMMEQLIIHQLALALWLTSHAFSGYVRVHNTQGEKGEDNDHVPSNGWILKRKRPNLMMIVVVVVVAVVAVAVCS